MHRILSLLICILLLISCNSNKNAMTVKNFTTAYFDLLTKKHPAVKFTIVDDSTITSKFNENDIRISVDNAYKEYQAEPDSIQTILSRYIAATSDLYSLEKKVNRDRIIPIIKPLSYLDDIEKFSKQMGATKSMDAFYEKYNDQLLIVYAEDKENGIHYLTQDDIKSLSIKSDSIKKIATNNLDKLLTNIERKGGDGVYMLTAGGNYEVSLILLDNI
jgi:hypothetical protein